MSTSFFNGACFKEFLYFFFNELSVFGTVFVAFKADLNFHSFVSSHIL